MSHKNNALASNTRYILERARNIDIKSVVERAKEVAETHGVSVPKTVADMLWSAARKDVAFQDYVDYDFAILTPEERATYMTHPVSNRIAERYANPDFRHIFHDKVEFNRRFADFLGRDWLVLDENNAAALEAFMTKHPTVVVKTPMGSAGSGVFRYHAADVSDWAAFHSELLGQGRILIEEVIQQHPDLAAVCPGTVNTTRVTAFFDGTDSHILATAQKFGRGQVSDQMSFGGFYTMLDDEGHSKGPGYDSHGHVHEFHPDSGEKIADFQLPMFDAVRAFIDKVARVVPEVQYVGWDVVVTPNGPVLIEGNWGAGVYENKPSVTGIRTGHKPVYQKAIGF